jgi:hypothetical protein
VPEVRGLLQPFAYGRGIVQYLDVATPAAGATASVVVDGRWWLRVLAARLTITTDANVANRLVTLDYIDARGVTRLRNGAGLVVPASQTAQAFEWDANRTAAEWATNTPVYGPVAPWFLAPGWVVKFNVTSIQATDAISGLSLWVETFGTEPGAYPIGPGYPDGPE